MMLGPVEFDSARKPRAGKADQCRLDYFLMIKDVVVSIGLILDRVNASPEVWQKQNPDELIFQTDGSMPANLRHIENLIDEREGINFAIGSLVDSLLEEQRMLFRLAHRVSRILEGDLFRQDQFVSEIHGIKVWLSESHG